MAACDGDGGGLFPGNQGKGRYRNGFLFRGRNHRVKIPFDACLVLVVGGQRFSGIYVDGPDGNAHLPFFLGKAYPFQDDGFDPSRHGHFRIGAGAIGWGDDNFPVLGVGTIYPKVYRRVAGNFSVFPCAGPYREDIHLVIGDGKRFLTGRYSCQDKDREDAPGNYVADT